ncbi:hypothetical protein ANN_06619 [Periplaneta americana]|uniref:Uncharacterized protein n=1 Tax=Periplaneta americana TaxID=6978 RepID=A0ABQ8TE11_PERAM|nr:hypothetical protein ANN_06619 [Periplaneta americana]
MAGLCEGGNEPPGSLKAINICGESYLARKIPWLGNTVVAWEHCLDVESEQEEENGTNQHHTHHVADWTVGLRVERGSATYRTGKVDKVASSLARSHSMRVLFMGLGDR